MNPSPLAPKHNAVVEYDPYSREIDIWHLDDRGDERSLVFELPINLRRPLVEKAIMEYGKRWIEWLSKQHMDVVPGSVVPSGPYPCLELDKLDMQQFCITARVKRSRPQRHKMVDVEHLFTAEPTPGNAADLLASGHRTTFAERERNARDRVEADKRVAQVRAERAEKDRDRAERGLPAFQPEPFEASEV